MNKLINAIRYSNSWPQRRINEHYCTGVNSAEVGTTLGLSHVADKGTPSGLRPASPEGKRQCWKSFNMLMARVIFDFYGLRRPVAPPLEELPEGLRWSLFWSHTITLGMTTWGHSSGQFLVPLTQPLEIAGL